jgi:LmbE family N-acetylglucosaminyl deacetylase
MKFAPVALLLSFALTAAAQKTFNDPANLRGERVAPLTGRELPIDQGARGLEQMLRKLNTRASLMLIVAHPDDEDSGMLTMYSRGMGADVALMTLNRGEGGQNAMTGDFEDALGLLRTQELLSADRYYGVEQMFGTEVDFGFSKTKEESFEKWGHERVLYDVVRAIRLYRPLVIASVFIGGVTDGHGQHQVSGEITQEAFKAAGDPKVFPELTAEGILPWQPLKVYERVPMGAITSKGLFDYATGHYTPARFVNYVTGQVTTTTPSVDVMVHEGKVDPLLAEADGTLRSYAQFGRMGLGMQKSQVGPGDRVPRAGAYDVGYHLYGSRVGTADQGGNAGTFFGGIDTSVMGIQSLAPNAFPAGVLASVSGEIEAATRAFDPKNPSAVAPELASALKNVDLLIKDVAAWKGDAVAKENVLHELRVKRVQLEDALRLALGLKFAIRTAAESSTLTVLFDFPYKTSVPVDWQLAASADSAVTVLGPGDGQATYPNSTFPAKNLKHPFEMAVNIRFNEIKDANSDSNPAKAWTAPYFTRPNIEQAFYNLLIPDLRNAPAKPPVAEANMLVRYSGVNFWIAAAPEPPLAITPALSVSLLSHARVFPLTSNSFTETAHVMSDSDVGLKGTLRLELPANWTVSPERAPVDFKKTGDTKDVTFTVTPNRTMAGTSAKITAVATAEGNTYSEGYRAVGYGDLPRTNYYRPATDHVVPVDLKLPARRRIGYLEGTGDAVPEALASIGLAPVMLKVSDLTAAKLAGFDTVILGVRAYNAHPDLHGAPTEALLEFARRGGNVVVQYQTGEFTGADAPYPLTLGYQAEKVVVEGDPVRLLKPDASLLRVPNVITTADFDGWIEERGHGFLGSCDPRYEALTEVHDPGQTPQEGGLVTARVGKGRWTYCAFALYRQLPEAVPGGYRLFVNLLEP